MKLWRLCFATGYVHPRLMLEKLTPAELVESLEMNMHFDCLAWPWPAKGNKPDPVAMWEEYQRNNGTQKRKQPGNQSQRGSTPGGQRHGPIA